jgi:hypothetical protein
MLNPKTKEYLQVPQSEKRAVLKKHYLANSFGATAQERALGHLGYLIEFTRRLNIVECKGSNQPMPNASALRKTDLLACVEICMESIKEDTYLKNENAKFSECCGAFEQLLERVKSKDSPEEFFEMAYLLFYLAALILKRCITDGTIEKEPQIFTAEAYKTLASRFAKPLFQPGMSAADQLDNLYYNFKSLARL